MVHVLENLAGKKCIYIQTNDKEGFVKDKSYLLDKNDGKIYISTLVLKEELKSDEYDYAFTVYYDYYTKINTEEMFVDDDKTVFNRKVILGAIYKQDNISNWITFFKFMSIVLIPISLYYIIRFILSLL